MRLDSTFISSKRPRRNDIMNTFSLKKVVTGPQF